MGYYTLLPSSETTYDNKKWTNNANVLMSRMVPCTQILSFYMGSLHCIGLSNSRNEYTVLDDLSSQGPLNL